VYEIFPVGLCQAHDKVTFSNGHEMFPVGTYWVHDRVTFEMCIKMYLTETHQENGFCPFNVPGMCPPVSRGPHPQCWVNQLVRDDIPRFRFFDDSELMGEDRK